MQISLKWVNELVDFKTIELDELVEKLTLGGFEVEDIIEIDIDGKKEIALDISATANRSDSLSIQGLGVELSALLNKQLLSLPTNNSISLWKNEIINRTNFDNSQIGCVTFLALSIENIEQIYTPKWMCEKLIASGITPVNSFDDFKNYILLETGYPFEFYDLDKIKAKLGKSDLKLNLSEAKKDHIFTASNKMNYSLDSSITIVKANDLVIGIAGIIENDIFCCTSQTKSILLEASIFTASKIRQQSRHIGLRTDRSARYEKSVKPSYLLEAVYRLISLLRINNQQLKCKLEISKQYNKTVKQYVDLNYKTVNEILGPTIYSTQENLKFITPSEISEYLSRLKFSFTFNDEKNYWRINIPESRTDDLTKEIDIVEEIGRLHGFNNFLTTLPKLNSVGQADLSYQTRKKITECLINLGLNEFIHYSLVRDKDLINNQVKLINPLLADCSSLRISLLPSLLYTIEQNLKQGNSIIEGFEYGHIFLNETKNRFKEQEYVSGVFGGNSQKSSWSESSRLLTWFEAKGKIEQLFNQLKLDVKWQTNKSTLMTNLLHPYRSAYLQLSNNKNLGYFGQINPRSAKKLGLPKELYLFEFDFETIKQNFETIKLPVYKNYSIFPKITKDISFIISQDVNFESLKNELRLNGTKFLLEINLLDEYKGDSIPKNHTSLCLQLVFQSKQKTLQTQQIEIILSNIENILCTKFGATLRS